MRRRLVAGTVLAAGVWWRRRAQPRWHLPEQVIYHYAWARRR